MSNKKYKLTYNHILKQLVIFNKFLISRLQSNCQNVPFKYVYIN